jgi:hypothetical protein
MRRWSDFRAALAAASVAFKAVEANWHDAFEEHAAIMEYYGGLSRAEAERRAAVDFGYPPNRILAAIHRLRAPPVPG